MESLFNVNGLMFWNAREIRLRRRFEEHFAAEMQTILLGENSAWRFVQFEGPQLTPRDLINPNYTNDDVWVQQADEETYVEEGPDGLGGPNMNNWSYRPDGDLVLRPETTPSSYVYAQYLLNTYSGAKPPFVVWQSGKSFRREQDQVTKNMRLKEFYQQEFQCIYTTETMNDYQEAVLEPVRKMIGEMVGLPTRIVESERLPSYSLRTMDVECNMSGRWMELCSISKRTDFPQKARFETKKGIVEKDLEVLEVAIGLCRCVYNFEQRRNK
jgi:glycyl-tRNA synthetase